MASGKALTKRLYNDYFAIIISKNTCDKTIKWLNWHDYTGTQGLNRLELIHWEKAWHLNPKVQYSHIQTNANLPQLFTIITFKRDYLVLSQISFWLLFIITFLVVFSNCRDSSISWAFLSHPRRDSDNSEPQFRVPLSDACLGYPDLRCPCKHFGWKVEKITQFPIWNYKQLKWKLSKCYVEFG